MSAPVLSLRDITVERGRRTVLRLESLDVNAGETLAVIGPNGAGKSTLVQVMSLLERPKRGDIRFAGEPVRGSPLAPRRRIAVVFQEPLLLDTTAEANAGAGLAIRGVARAERERRTAVWLERFGVAHLAERSARTLSGGEAQRVSLARALVLEPELLLLDEPFAALDAPTRQALMNDLGAVLAERETATVFVTHDRTEALRLGDRLAVLIDGRVRQVGSPADVFSTPADEDVAAFVGIETIVPGRVLAADGGVATVDVGGRLIEGGGDVRSDDQALVCLRPEDVTLAPLTEGGPASSARNHLSARVTGVLQAGPFVRVELDAGFPLVALITKQSLEDLALAPGTEVLATFKATAVHLIPKGAHRA